MKILILFVSFFFTSTLNLIASDIDECLGFIEKEYNFTQDRLDYETWSFEIQHAENEDCIQCPPFIYVDNFSSDAGVNGLHKTQLIEINGENYLSYNNDEDFINTANKVIDESENLKIKVIYDENGDTWDLEGLDETDINDENSEFEFKIFEIAIDKKFKSLIPVKFEIEVVDIQVEDKSSNIRTLLDIQYYYHLEKFSEYSLNNIDFEICSFDEKYFDKILYKIFVPKLYDAYSGTNIKNFIDINKKRKINEISFFKSKSIVEIYVNETLLIDSKPKNEFSKFPYDTLTTNITLSPQNFISSDYKFEDWERVEKNALQNIFLDEWKLNNILFTENALNRDFMIDLITNDSELSEEVKSLTTKTMNTFGIIEFIDIDFDLKRKHQFYTLKVIVPVFFIVLISFTTFWIRNNQIEAKLNLAIVSLLALIAYNFIVNNDIPKIAEITVLDSFILISYLFTGFCTFISVYSYYDYRRDKLTGDFNPIDVKLRYLAPLAYILSILFFGILIYNNIFF